jgi:lambda family phage tail tape measure protein
MATIDQYKIQIDVSGQGKVDDLNKSVKNADKSLEDLQDQAKKTEQAFNTLGNGLQKVGNIAAAALALIGGTALRTADEMNDLGDAFGLNAGFVKGLAQSLEEAGGKFDGVGKVLMNFYKSLDEVANLNVDTQEAFKELGITLKDLEGKTNIQIFEQVIEKLANMEQGAARTALGIKIFGKEFSSIDPAKLQEILQTKDFARLESEMMLAAAATAAMEKNFRMLQDAFLRFIEPFLGGAQDMVLTAEEADKAIKILAATFALAFGASAVANVIKMAGAIKTLASAAGLLAKNPVFRALALGGLAVGGLVAGKNLMEDAPAGEDPEVKKQQEIAKAQQQQKNIGEIIRAQQSAVAEQQQRSFDLQNANVQAALEYQKAVNGTANLTKQEADRQKVRLDTERQLKIDLANIDAKITEEQNKKGYVNQALIATYEQQKQIIKDQSAESEKQKLAALALAEAERARTVDLQNQLGIMQQQSEKTVAMKDAELARQVITGQITEKQKAQQLELIKIQESGALKELQLARQIAAEKDDIKRKELENELARVKSATDFAISEERRKRAEQQALEQSYSAGVVKGLEQIAEQFKPINMAQKAVADTWGSISNAVDTFVSTGKFKFSDFARSIVADLAKMIAKALIFRAISGFLGSVGIPLPGFAEGGNPPVGKASIVGEKGPELFVPKQAGTVIPNNKLGNMMSSQPVQQQPVVNNYNYNNNINAVDAKSVATLFYENRKALFGATNQARRELPYGAAA